MADEISPMPAFDFGAPINVTVIYDDSDEDTKDIITLISDKKQTECSDEQSNLEKKTPNITDKRKIKTNQLNSSNCENTFPENKISSIEADDRNNNKLEIPTIRKSPTVDHVSNCNSHIALSTDTPSACKYPNEETNLNKNSRILNNIDVDVMKKEYQEVRNYIHTLLTTVSEHLILIVNAYKDHSRIVDKYLNLADGHLRIQDSKARYNRYKTHIFQLSYSAVVAVILKKETNNEFIEGFIDNTVKIANGKYQLQYTAQCIKPFFFDMLLWSKQERNYMNKKPSNEIPKSIKTNKNDTPLLSMQLSLPAKVPSSTLQKKTKKDEKKDKNNILSRTSDQSSALSKNAGYQEPYSVPIYSCGPPDREVRLSIQSNLLHIQNQQMAQITNMQHRAPPPVAEPPNFSRPENYYANQNNRYANNNVVNNVSPNCNNIMTVAPTVTYSHQTIIHPLNDLNKQNYAQVNSTSTWYPQRPCIGLPSQPMPSLREFRCHNNLNIQQCNNIYQHQFTSPDRNQSGNFEDRNEQNVQNTSISPKRAVESGRSVSTDRRFISPLQFNNGGDNTPLETMEHSTSFTPLITHVTSLNPNAVQIAQGSCHVCGKPTKTKCMGCYQIYYCNYQCEHADWSKHMYLCRRSTESQQVNFV